MDRRYLILGAGIIVSLVSVFGLQILHSETATVNSTPGSETAVTTPNANKLALNTPIPLPPLVERKVNQLTLQPGSKAGSVNLREDTSDSWRNMETAITLQPSLPVALTTTLRADKERRILVFIYAGTSRLRCVVDPRTGATNAVVFGSAANVECTATAKAEGWWDVRLSGVLDKTRDDATQGVVVVAMASQRSEEAYQGDGQSQMEVTDARVHQ